MKMFFFTVFTVFYFALATYSSQNYLNTKETYEADKVLLLPTLWPQPNFTQYSGYLNGSSGNIKLHYWLIEAVNSSETTPLILWLNGGPGCSSIEGLLDEHGPFNVVEGPRLVANPYSWNNVGDVLYLEAPAGVGFSYAVDGNVTTDDDQTSLNNYYALLHFLDKFPHYKERDFFITGESYAGVYVPTLALRIIESRVLNLKGIAVGNGLTSYKLNDNSLLYFMNYHGLLNESLWSKLLNKCCPSKTKLRCMFTEVKTSQCEGLVAIATTFLTGLNIYNLYDHCAGGVSQIERMKRLDFAQCGLDLLFRHNRYIQTQRMYKLSDRAGVGLDIPCVDNSNLVAYLNLPLVRQALHVADSVRLPTWELCSDGVFRDYIRSYTDLSAQYKSILEAKVPILIFNGDTDMACNFLGGEWFVDDLGLKIKSPRDHWFYLDSNGTEQVGGFRKVVELNGTALIYMTVLGAGHMVPKDKPVQALKLIKTFIESTNSKALQIFNFNIFAFLLLFLPFTIISNT